MKLVAILRVKNEVAVAGECLTKLSEIADEILVVDNGSTDGTLGVYPQFPKVKKIISTEGYDEGRDKILLLESARKADADWIMWIDADEVFEDHFTRQVAEKYMRSKYNRISFRMCNFWLGRKRFRVDRGYYLYSLHPQRSMWRNLPAAYFKNQKIHNGDIRDVPGPVYLSPYRIKHFGFIDTSKMEEKLKKYLLEDKSDSRDYVNNIDPSIPHLTIPFIEFENRLLNTLYILCYKYGCNALWLVERARRKVMRVLHL